MANADLQTGMGRRTLLFLLGASRGFGRSVLFKGLEALRGHKDLRVVLMGLSIGKMEELRGEITQSAAAGQKIAVDVEGLNLEKATDAKAFNADVENIFAKYPLDGVGTIIVFSNSGAAESCYFHSYTPEVIARMTAINCTSFYLFTSALTRWLVNSIPKQQAPPVVRLIETSSFAAVNPFNAMGIYCAQKADRLMLYRCFATEARAIPELKDVDIKTLSYGPGPMKTDIVADFASSEDPVVKSFFNQSSGFIKPDVSAAALWNIIMGNDYPSGKFVDYSEIATVGPPS